MNQWVVLTPELALLRNFISLVGDHTTVQVIVCIYCIEFIAVYLVRRCVIGDCGARGGRETLGGDVVSSA